MESLIRIFADFNNADKENRFRLNTTGSINDLRNQNITLVPGIKILLDNDEGLTFVGIVEFSEDEQIWVARVDKNDFR